MPADALAPAAATDASGNMIVGSYKVCWRLNNVASYTASGNVIVGSYKVCQRLSNVTSYSVSWSPDQVTLS